MRVRFREPGQNGGHFGAPVGFWWRTAARSTPRSRHPPPPTRTSRSMKPVTRSSRGTRTGTSSWRAALRACSGASPTSPTTPPGSRAAPTWRWMHRGTRSSATSSRSRATRGSNRSTGRRRSGKQLRIGAARLEQHRPRRARPRWPAGRDLPDRWDGRPGERRLRVDREPEFLEPGPVHAGRLGRVPPRRCARGMGTGLQVPVLHPRDEPALPARSAGPTEVVVRNREVLVGWSSSDSSDSRVHVQRKPAGGAWSPNTETLSEVDPRNNFSGHSFGPSLAADAQGNVIANWTRSATGNELYENWLGASATSFEPRRRVTPEGGNFGGGIVGFDSSGNGLLATLAYGPPRHGLGPVVRWHPLRGQGAYLRPRVGRVREGQLPGEQLGRDRFGRRRRRVGAPPERGRHSLAGSRSGSERRSHLGPSIPDCRPRPPRRRLLLPRPRRRSRCPTARSSSRARPSPARRRCSPPRRRTRSTGSSGRIGREKVTAGIVDGSCRTRSACARISASARSASRPSAPAARSARRETFTLPSRPTDALSKEVLTRRSTRPGIGRS